MIEDIENIKVGDMIRLKNLNFYNRSGIVVNSSKPVLEELLEIMQGNPKLKIEIQGHICCQLGTDLENIGGIRAYAVYNFLVENQIEKADYTIKVTEAVCRYIQFLKKMNGKEIKIDALKF